jgi:hypothetical protein
MGYSTIIPKFGYCKFMYHLSDDNIDKLFSSLKDLEREPDAMLWSEISQQLPNSGFLSWGAKHFNIYYAAAGISALLVFFFASLSQSPKQTGKLRSLTTYKKIDSSTLVISEPEEKKITNNTPVIKEKKNIIVADTAKTTEDLVTPIKPIEVPEPVKLKAVDSIPVKTKAKKIVTIVRRDTLRVMDTVSVKRKRK